MRIHNSASGRRRLRFESLESRRLLAADSLLSHGPDEPTSRIVGGTETEDDAWPWMASLDSSRPFCGGALIAPDAIVTAAHCVEGISVDAFDVSIGKNDLTDNGGKLHRATEIIVHPEYNPFSNDADIAVVFLETPSSATTVSPLQPEQADLAAPGRSSRVLGWGRLAEGGQLPDSLRQVQLPIVSNELANRPESYNGAVTDRMLPAGLVDGSKDSCQGDSGGPLLVANDDGENFLAGIVSWGDGCARPNKFGIYTRVSSFAQWIAETVNIDSSGTVNFTQERYVADRTVYVRLRDADLAGAMNVSVDVTTDTGDFESIELTEASPGRFFGNISLTQSPTTIGNGQLDVNESESIRVTYRDQDDGTGLATSVFDSATIVVDDHASDANGASDIVPDAAEDGEIEITGDADWFRFPVTSNMVYRIDVNLNGSLNDSVLDLFDESADRLIDSNDDGGPAFASRIAWQADYDGLAHLQVRGYESQIGTYELSVVESAPAPDDHGNDANGASAITLDQPMGGDIAVLGDVDWFSFSTTAGKSYQITTELLTLSDSVMRLLADDGVTELVTSDDVGMDLASRIIWNAQDAEAHYVEVSGFENATGEYELNVVEFVTPPDDHANGPKRATLIDFPSTTAGDLAFDGDVDWFAFEAVRGARYQFDVELETLGDSRLRILDLRQNELAFNDDAGISLASRIEWMAPNNDTFFVEVSGFDVTETGRYQLVAQQVADPLPDDHGDSAESATVVELPWDASGVLGLPGDVDVFQFSAVAGVVYDVGTAAGSLSDTTLTLSAADGTTQLAFNDDHELELTSYIQWQALKNGPLYVTVGGFAEGQGTYSLSISVPYGDANRDGVFNSKDIVQVLQRGEFDDDLVGNSTWEDGDWNGDGEFTSADIVAALQRNAFS